MLPVRVGSLPSVVLRVWTLAFVYDFAFASQIHPQSQRAWDVRAIVVAMRFQTSWLVDPDGSYYPDLSLLASLPNLLLLPPLSLKLMSGRRRRFGVGARRHHPPRRITKAPQKKPHLERRDTDLSLSLPSQVRLTPHIKQACHF